jgi:hypothetical protein
MTQSFTVADSEGKSWIKIILDPLDYCVEKVMEYGQTGNTVDTWTCTNKDCSNCVGRFCNVLSLTVSSVRAVANNLNLNCQYGDTVQLVHVNVGHDHELNRIGVVEIAIFGKQGKNKITC